MRTIFLKTCTVCLLLLLIISSEGSYAQKVLQLTNVSTEKKQILKEGHRVRFFLTDGSNSLGIIDKVNESTVTISGEDFTLDQFKSIGRKRKGSGFGAFMCGFVGTGLIIGAIQNANSDPCPSCTTEESSGEGWIAVEIGMGVAVLGLGVNTIVRNSPRDVINKWKLEIVDSTN